MGRRMPGGSSFFPEIAQASGSRQKNITLFQD